MSLEVEDVIDIFQSRLSDLRAEIPDAKPDDTFAMGLRLGSLQILGEVEHVLYSVMSVQEQFEGRVGE